MAVASLVLGIISVVCSFIGGLNFVGLVLGIVGIVLGVLGKKKTPEKSGMATAGIVLSIIGVVLTAIILIACAACFGSVGGFAACAEALS